MRVVWGYGKLWARIETKPPVIKNTLPARSGMSLSGLNDLFDPMMRQMYYGRVQEHGRKYIVELARKEMHYLVVRHELKRAPTLIRSCQNIARHVPQYQARD